MRDGGGRALVHVASWEAVAGGTGDHMLLVSGAETTCHVSELPDVRSFGLAASVGEFGGACKQL